MTKGQRDILWKKRVLESHFDPHWGSPYWLERTASLDFDARREIRSIEDLERLGPMPIEKLAERPLEHFIPKRFHDRLHEFVTSETGLYDHWSVMEREQRYEELLPDVVRAYEHLVDAAADPPRRVVLGYSLGAILAGRLAALVDATHVVGLSPPVSKVSLDVYRDQRIPRLFVGGDRDFAFDRDRFDDEFAQLLEPKLFVPLDGCDHFYRKQEERLYQALAPFVLGDDAR